MERKERITLASAKIITLTNVRNTILMVPQKRGVKKAKNAVTGMLPIYAYSLLIPTCAPELIVSSNTIRAVQLLKTMIIF